MNAGNLDFAIFGFALMDEILVTYSLRIASVYMFSIGALWLRAKVVPRWLTIITVLVATGFLFLPTVIGAIRFIFPGWVLVVSIYILILNYRIEHDSSETLQ